MIDLKGLHGVKQCALGLARGSAPPADFDLHVGDGGQGQRQEQERTAPREWDDHHGRRGKREGRGTTRPEPL